MSRGLVLCRPYPKGSAEVVDLTPTTRFERRRCFVASGRYWIERIAAIRASYRCDAKEMTLPAGASVATCADGDGLVQHEAECTPHLSVDYTCETVRCFQGNWSNLQPTCTVNVDQTACRRSTEAVVRHLNCEQTGGGVGECPHLQGCVYTPAAGGKPSRCTDGCAAVATPTAKSCMDESAEAARAACYFVDRHGKEVHRRVMGEEEEKFKELMTVTSTLTDKAKGGDFDIGYDIDGSEGIGAELPKDLCGVPGGDSSTCKDQCGVPNGENDCVDVCGVADGDGTSCNDRCGVPNGHDDCVDDCDVPDGSNACMEHFNATWHQERCAVDGRERQRIRCAPTPNTALVQFALQHSGLGMWR